MRSISVWILSLTLLAGACGAGDEPAGEPEGEPPAPAETLPDGAYGTWLLQSTSGGISGRGDPSAPHGRLRMTITRDHEVVLQRRGGEERRAPFEVRIGRSISHEDPMPFLACPELGIEGVVALHGDDGMTLSENHYDGFLYHYRRISGDGWGPDLETVARTQLKELKNVLELHYMENARYPDALADLAEPREGAEPWIDEVPLDPWGEPYVYEVEGRDLTLVSKGPDRLEGTADDISLR